MLLLSIGIVWWATIHLTPSVAPEFRRKMIDRLGEPVWKGLFALDILIALALIVIGWRSAAVQTVYLPPAWGRQAALLLMALSVFLFGAAQGKSAVRRFVRHPMLASVVTWSVAHLIANGDLRSLVLFGGLGIWALVEMPLINRREGAWIRPDAQATGGQLKGVLISIVVYALLVVLHPYFAGVAPIAH